ncbi:MAG: acyl-CoA dehydrogenase family protein [Acidimicrobiales bacterium]
MELSYSPAECGLRDELRAYFAQLMTPAMRDLLRLESEGGPTYRSLVRQMGADGWLGLGWPVQFGGQGRPAGDQFIFFDEAQRAGAPVPLVTLNTVGPTLMKYGSERQRLELLPRILTGDVLFAIGYTEADAGTDLASLRTRARRDGDEFVITGSKVFTSSAHDADFVWLAARTDPNAAKHNAISILLVPTTAPGFSLSPIVTVGGMRTNATFYDDVRVPIENLVGEENLGWRMVTNQLNHERVALAALGGLGHRLWDDTWEWANQTHSGDGRRVIDLSWVRADLARSYALLEAMKLLNWRMTADVGAGTLKPSDSSAVKVYGTEALVQVYRLLLGILGRAGFIRPGSSGATLHGEVERAARTAQINTFGGGVNEIQREIVASAGLGLPRVAR